MTSKGKLESTCGRKKKRYLQNAREEGHHLNIKGTHKLLTEFHKSKRKLEKWIATDP